MQRTIYETASNLSNEATVADIVTTVTGTVFKKNPRFYEIDLSILGREGNGILGFAEIKVRTNASTAFPTYMISAHKIMAARQIMETFSVPVYLIIGFTDGIKIHCIEYNCDYYKLEYGGRTVRTRDPQDLEPVVHIPMNMFYPLCSEALG